MGVQRRRVLYTNKVQDLTDTYWKLPEPKDCESGGGAYYLNYSIRGERDCDYIEVPYIGLSTESLVGYAYYRDTSILSLSQYGINHERTAYGWSSAIKSFTSNPNMQYIHIKSGENVKNKTLLQFFNEKCTRCDSNWNPI